MTTIVAAWLEYLTNFGSDRRWIAFANAMRHSVRAEEESEIALPPKIVVNFPEATLQA